MQLRLLLRHLLRETFARLHVFGQRDFRVFELGAGTPELGFEPIDARLRIREQA